MKSDFVSANQVNRLVNNSSVLTISIDDATSAHPMCLPLCYTRRTGNLFEGRTCLSAPVVRDVSGVVMDTSHEQGEGYALYFRGQLNVGHGNFALRLHETSVNGGIWNKEYSIWMDERQKIKLSPWSCVENGDMPSEGTSDIFSFSKSLLLNQKYMVLSTCNGVGKTHTSPVYFQQGHPMELNWLSSEKAVHSQNIAGNENISVLIIDSTNPYIALRFNGTAYAQATRINPSVDWRTRSVQQLCAGSKTLKGKDALFLSAHSPRIPYSFFPKTAEAVMMDGNTIPLNIKQDGSRRYLTHA